MDYSAEAMGEAVRIRRLKQKMTQKELGEAAGYGKGAGAGVAISRIERGETVLGQARLSQIAQALQTTVQRLEQAAQTLTRAFRDREHTTSDGRPLPVKQRLERLQRRISERSETVEKLGYEFNTNQEKARDDFFMPFVAVAAEVEGAPEVNRPDEPSEHPTGRSASRADAEYRVRLAQAGVAQALTGGAAGMALGAGAGGAAAFATFSIAASVGTASTGVAISGLTGIAASNATLALLGGGTLAAGGAGVAGGTLLLAGIVAAPAALLALGGAALWMRKKQREAQESVERAEAQLAATEPGFVALVKMLRQASRILGAIGVHGGRAFQKWQAKLPEIGPIAWKDLTEDQRNIYTAFLTLTACQLAVLSINAEAFMAAQDKTTLIELIEVSEATLATAEDMVNSLV